MPTIHPLNSLRCRELLNGYAGVLVGAGKARPISEQSGCWDSYRVALIDLANGLWRMAMWLLKSFRTYRWSIGVWRRQGDRGNPFLTNRWSLVAWRTAYGNVIEGVKLSGDRICPVSVRSLCARGKATKEESVQA